MKSIQKSVLLLVLIAGFISQAFAQRPNLADKGFAVVELFTSEGCSSCPPADELVARIEKEYQNQPVYILAFHVDYWNRLGWKDVFSSADYSKRQQDYAKSLHLSSVYTPQIVINGTKEFVGSQEGNLRSSIKAGLQKAAPAQISLTDIKNNGSQLTVNYHTGGISKNCEIVWALVQKSAQTNVKAGENKGHTLTQVQIVRELKSTEINSNKAGSAQLALPKLIAGQNLEVIALLQDTESGQILGAAKQTLPRA